MSNNILHEKTGWATTSPVGPLLLTMRAGKIVSVEFVTGGPFTAPPDDLFADAELELEEYFAGRRRKFDLALDFSLAATPFRKRVWALVNEIPYGETMTYGEIAARLGSSPRAVGGAMNANPIPIFLPCHRVVAASGLGGYGGDWESGKALSIKEKLLELERDG